MTFFNLRARSFSATQATSDFFVAGLARRKERRNDLCLQCALRTKLENVVTSGCLAVAMRPVLIGVAEVAGATVAALAARQQSDDKQKNKMIDACVPCSVMFSASILQLLLLLLVAPAATPSAAHCGSLAIGHSGVKKRQWAKRQWSRQQTIVQASMLRDPLRSWQGSKTQLGWPVTSPVTAAPHCTCRAADSSVTTEMQRDNRRAFTFEAPNAPLLRQ